MKHYQIPRLTPKRTNLLTGDKFVLTEEQYQFLLAEEKLHLSGQTKSYTREEARQIIMGFRDY